MAPKTERSDQAIQYIARLIDSRNALASRLTLVRIDVSHRDDFACHGLSDAVADIEAAIDGVDAAIQKMKEATEARAKVLAAAHRCDDDAPSTLLAPSYKVMPIKDWTPP